MAEAAGGEPAGQEGTQAEAMEGTQDPGAAEGAEGGNRRLQTNCKMEVRTASYLYLT